jgi:hypothetical protein
VEILAVIISALCLIIFKDVLLSDGAEQHRLMQQLSNLYNKKVQEFMYITAVNGPWKDNRLCINCYEARGCRPIT